MNADFSTPKTLSRVLLFTGEGKGKTTAALGMALRAVGHGQRVLILQFIKADSSVGEIAALREMNGIEIIQTGRGFLPPSTNPAFAEHREAAERGLSLAEEAIGSGEYDLVVLDEICVAVAKGLLHEEDVVRAISINRPVTLVLTGRNAGERLISMADTVSEMRCIKHGLKNGWKKQTGVEY